MFKTGRTTRYRLHDMRRERRQVGGASTAAVEAPSFPGGGRFGKRWTELTVLLVGQSLGSLAVAIVSVAAPAIGDHLRIGGGLLQMAVSGYGLAYAVLLVTGARLGDWGHRRFFLSGVALFSVAGLVSGLAPASGFLVAGQLLQGAGAAILIPQVLSLIQLTFSGAARKRAVSLYSMTLGLGVAAGLLLGGLLITADPMGLSWRAVFLINVPIGCLVLVGGRLWLPVDPAGGRQRLDWRGFLLFTMAIGLLVVPLAFGPSAGWPVWTWVMLAAGFAMVLAFTRAERAADRRGIRPLLDLAALGVPGMVPGLVVVFVSMGGYGALVYTMSAYLQEGLHYGVLNSSLIFSAYAIAFGLVNLTWSKLPPRYHPRVSPVALTMLFLAEAALAITIRDGFALAAVVPLLALAGAGHGAGFGAVVARLTAHMPARYASAASGIINTTTQLAILAGIAGLGSAFLAGAQPPRQVAGYAQSMSDLLIVLAIGSAIAVFCSLRVSRPFDSSQSTDRPRQAYDGAADGGSSHHTKTIDL